MKEAYFTEKNICSRGSVFKSNLKANCTDKSWYLKPEHTALLVLDMQNFFLDPLSHAYVPSAGAIIPNILKVARQLYNKGGQVFYTRHLNTKKNAKNMGTWWRDILTDSDPLSQIKKDLIIPNSQIITKSQYDAFFKTRLEPILQENNIRQLIVSGVMTHLCCETTARSAFIRGFDVFFGIDMTATYNRDFHMASLLNLSHGFARPVLSGEILKSLNEH